LNQLNETMKKKRRKILLTIQPAMLYPWNWAMFMSSFCLHI
jgi:hypothetical protein